MKKSLFVFIFISFFIFSGNVFALTSEQDNALNEFISNYYSSDKPYCLMNYNFSSNNDYYKFYCVSSETDLYLSSSASTIKNKNQAETVIHILKTNSTIDYFIYSSSTITSNLSQSLNTFVGANFDVYKLNGELVYEKNLNYDNNINPDSFELTFILPSDSTLVLKDSNNNIITPDNGSIFYLPEGTYYYSVSKAGFKNLDNIELILNDNKVVNVTLESAINTTNYHSLYSQYYNYIGALVSSIFGLNNPFFLYIIAFIIGFSIIILIKRMLGGR